MSWPGRTLYQQLVQVIRLFCSHFQFTKTGATWGREDFPILSPRFLKPFRGHHVTPTSFVEWGFMNTNGDTALIGIPFLLSIFLWPLDSNVGFVMASFQLAFCVLALPTNQIHQWARSPKPPKIVTILQRLRLILPPSSHQLHHAGTHDRDYCITSGCCNRILERIQFFRTLESMVEQFTGFKPRSDENQKKMNTKNFPDSPDEVTTHSRLDGESVRFGSGWMSGVGGLNLGLTGLGCVVCFHLPDTFTVPQLRADFPQSQTNQTVAFLTA